MTHTFKNGCRIIYDIHITKHCAHIVRTFQNITHHTYTLSNLVLSTLCDCVCIVHVCEDLKKKLAHIRGGPPGTRRSAETMFIMKITKKDSKGKKKLDPNSAEFRDYLSRYEDPYVV